MEFRLADYSADVIAVIDGADRISLAVAFVTESGVAEVRRELLRALRSGSEARVLLDLSTGATDPSAVWDLVALSNRHRARFKLKALIRPGVLLHSKLYIGADDREMRMVVGSANLSAPALKTNVEHGIFVSSANDDDFGRTLLRSFDDLWNADDARTIDEEAARLYETFCGRIRAAQDRANRRARAAWRRVVAYLEEQHPTFTWPSPEAGFILGVVCARGAFDDEGRVLRVRLRLTGQEYRLQGRSFDGDEVRDAIMHHLQERFAASFPGVSPVVDAMKMTVDFSAEPDSYTRLREPLEPFDDTSTFQLPKEIGSVSVEVIAEFVRGFAVASGLVTDGTSLPPNPITGDLGLMTVWLRPKTGNKRLFDQLHALIEARLGMPVYTQWREYREPHLKMRCQDFAEIGFGIRQLDALVAEGAAYNEAVFPS